MRLADKMRERHADLLARMAECRPEDNQLYLRKLLNELSNEIKELSATDWDISSRTYIIGHIVDVTISEGENDTHDGHKKIIGVIKDEKTANEIIILHNESRGALLSALYCMEDASFRLGTHDYEDAIIEIKNVLARLATSS